MKEREGLLHSVKLHNYICTMYTCNIHKCGCTCHVFALNYQAPINIQNVETDGDNGCGGKEGKGERAVSPFTTPH